MPLRAALRAMGLGHDADADTMSQLFHRHSNIYSRLSIAALGVFAVGLGAVIGLLHLGSFYTNQDVYVAQPVQFSHAHHVGGLDIDCRYCHTSVEESAFANIPPTKTCMNCHSQIWSNAPILEPVRASFRDNTRLAVDARPRSARLRVLQSQHPRTRKASGAPPATAASIACR